MSSVMYLYLEWKLLSTFDLEKDLRRWRKKKNFYS